MNKWFIVSLSLLAPLLSSCGTAPKQSFDMRAKQCADQLAQAEKLIAEEKFMRAREILDPLAERCMGSGTSEKASYLLGEADYGLEDWISARSDFSLYLSQYPNSEYSSLASYRRALASYHMPYRKGRDGSYTRSAIDDFESFLYRYPSSAKVDSAKIYLDELNERLALDKYEIGKLYLKMGEPQAAVLSYKDFMVSFPNSRYIPTALEDLVGAYVRLDQYSQARLYVDTLALYLDSNSVQPKKLFMAIDLAEKSFNARIKDEESYKKQKNQP